MSRLLAKTGLLDTGQLVPGSITALGTVTSGTISTGAVIDDPTMTQGSDATGDVYYRAADGKLTRLATTTDGHVLTSTGAGAVPAFEAVPAGGIENVEVWYLEADTAAGTSNFTPVTGWSRADDSREGTHVADGGVGMTEASDGIWAFPQTGMWWIRLNAMMASNGAAYSTNVEGETHIMYDNAVSGGFNTMNHKYVETGQNGIDWAQFSLFSETLVDVTTLDARLKIHKNSSGSGWQLRGQAATPRQTTLSFMRVGAT